MTSMFWGLRLEPGKRYTTTVDKSFHVSMAALDCATVKSDKDVQTVMLEEGDSNTFILCNLQKPKVLQSRLDLNFMSGDRITFFCRGNGTVHLTGYIMPDDDDDDEDFAAFGEEGEEVEEEEEDEEEEEEDAEEKGKGQAAKGKSKVNGLPAKRKGEAAAVAPAKKKKQDLQTQDDEDSDDSGEDEVVDEEEEDESGEEEEEDAEEAMDEEESEEESDEENETQAEEKVTAPAANLDQKSKKKKKNKQGLPNQQSPNAQQQQQEKKKQQNAGQQQQNAAQQKKKPQQQQQQSNEKPAAEGQPKKTLEGGVIVKDIKVGNGPLCKPGRMATVYYTGRLKTNNKVFDQSQHGAGFKFRVGRGEVIKGWDVGLPGMKVGGKRLITIPPNMGYGQKGSPPTIPGNSTLVFEVELKAVN